MAMDRIMIVEDNDAFRGSLREILNIRFPHTSIREAANGAEALRLLEDFAPDLIFMDIRLPGVNGLELTRKIKSHNCEAVVIVLTSYELPEYRDAAYQCGASYFFTKGIATSHEIMATVESLFHPEIGGVEPMAGANGNG